MDKIISNTIAIIAVIIFLANLIACLLVSNYSESFAWFCAAIWALISIKK